MNYINNRPLFFNAISRAIVNRATRKAHLNPTKNRLLSIGIYSLAYYSLSLQRFIVYVL